MFNRKLNPFYGVNIFIRSKKNVNITVYYFDTKTVEKINYETKEYENYNILNITTIREGYYIITDNKTINVYYKGEMPYYLFLLNKKEDNVSSINIDIDTIDGKKETIAFYNLIDNIYIHYADDSDIIGFTKYGEIIKSPFKKTNSKMATSYYFVSKINKTSVEKQSYTTTDKDSHYSSTTNNKLITSSKDKTTINTKVSSATITTSKK